MRIAINNKKFILVLSLGAVLVLITAGAFILFTPRGAAQNFDGSQAYEDVKYQLDLGPRTMGSAAHDQSVSWIINQLENQHWKVTTQETVISGKTVKNIIAKRGEGTPWIILGSHYDSRSTADRDPDPANRNLPVPGANDGASSTAILLELARVLPDTLNKQVWLVFFDAEDDGNNSGSGWANGSDYFVSQLQGKPDSVVVLDMVGDKDLNIFMEGNSDPSLNTEIWETAQELGYTQFIPQYKYDLVDDQIPFVKAGIRAADVIDFDYPYWHTTGDTLDKVSVQSLQVLGDTIQKWLEQYPATADANP